jgi:hypothetical protein
MYYECAVEALPTPPSNLQIPISSHPLKDGNGTKRKQVQCRKLGRTKEEREGEKTSPIRTMEKKLDDNFCVCNASL